MQNVFNLKLYTHNSTQNDSRPLTFICNNIYNRGKVTVTIAKVINNYFTDQLKKLNLESGVKIRANVDKKNKMFNVFDRDEYVIKILNKHAWCFLFNSTIKYKVILQIESLENIYNC